MVYDRPEVIAPCRHRPKPIVGVGIKLGEARLNMSSRSGKHFNPNTHTSTVQHRNQTFDRKLANFAIL
jgi:hypothetical protein